MKLVPSHHLLFGCLLLLIGLLIAIQFIWAPAPETSVNHFASTQVVDHRAQFSMIAILLSTVLFILVYLLFLYGVNRPQLQQLVSTSLYLAGIDTSIGYVGRKWQLDQHTVLQLHHRGQVTFELISHPTDRDPRLFGFKLDDQWIRASCQAESLQLLLQSWRRYKS